MAIFDFEALKDKAKDLAQTGVSKSKQLGEIAKLNLANVGLSRIQWFRWTSQPIKYSIGVIFNVPKAVYGGRG